MHKVTIIGSGNAFNSNGRAHACYLLENDAGEAMLLDIGATSLYRLQQEGTDLNAIPFLLLTHFHGDHIGGLPFLLIELDIVRQRKSPLTILGPAGVQAACEALIEICYPGFDFHFPIEYREVPARGTTRAGEFRIESFPITHKDESTGYRVSGSSGKTFAFSGDAAFDERLVELVDGVDVAAIELSMETQSDPPTKHVALDEVRARRDELRPRRLIFTHIYDDLAAKVEHEGLGEAAYDGMVVSFD